MRRLITLSAVFCALTIPYPHAAWGQEMKVETAIQRLSEWTAAHPIIMDGAEDPASLPFSQKVRSLLRHFPAFSPALASHLSTNAMNTLQAAAAAEERDSKTDNAASEAIYNEVCRNIDRMDAVSIARRLNDRVIEFHRRREQRYWLWLHQIPESELSYLLAFLDEQVAPSIRGRDADGIALAAALPVEYKLAIRDICRQRQSWAPAVKTRELEASADGPSDIQIRDQ